MIYRFDTLGSTNAEASDARYAAGDVVWAEYQSAGRGQRGHTWTSPRGDNLMFSIVEQPRTVAVRDQFAVLQAAAVALTDMFADYGIATRIKWTNDIYAGERKITGVLIEHTLAEGHLERTVIGIGINVNQTVFDASLPNPVSMRLVSGRTFDRREVLDTFCRRFAARLETVAKGDYDSVRRAYVERMYRLGCEQRFRDTADGREFDAVIRGVLPSGELCLEHADGSTREYRFREVEFVIKNATENAELSK